MTWKNLARAKLLQLQIDLNPLIIFFSLADDIINYERSLPPAPGTLEDSRDAGDSGYDEICDVIPTGNTALADYEVPVLLEEEEEAESIYDVHPDWFNQIQHHMGRVVTSNMGPLSTQM